VWAGRRLALKSNAGCALSEVAILTGSNKVLQIVRATVLDRYFVIRVESHFGWLPSAVHAGVLVTLKYLPTLPRAYIPRSCGFRGLALGERGMNRILSAFRVVARCYPLPSGVVLVKSALAFVIRIKGFAVNVVNVLMQEGREKTEPVERDFGTKVIYRLLVSYGFLFRNDRNKHFPLSFEFSVSFWRN
jgi:hypothetical protein